MNRHDRRRARAIGIGDANAASGAPRKANLSYRFSTSSPRVLLLGTALASTFLVASMVAPAPARAQTTCVGNVGNSNPIEHIVSDSIVCSNDELRVGDNTTTPPFAAINLETNAGGAYSIELYNGANGTVQSNTAGGTAYGIRTVTTTGDDSPIAITNHGSINTSAAAYAYGFFARTDSDRSTITVTNTGKVVVEADSYGAYGLHLQTFEADSAISVTNTGEIVATGSAGAIAYGIYLDTVNTNSQIYVKNSAKITVAGTRTEGIDAETDDSGGSITIKNYAAIVSNADTSADVIDAETSGQNSAISITNTGALTATSGAAAGGSAVGIEADTDGNNSFLTVTNSGAINVTANGNNASAYGIYLNTYGDDSPITVNNTGNITATALGNNGETEGIYAYTELANSSIEITNSGNIVSRADDTADAIDAETDDDNSHIQIVNTGKLTVEAGGGDTSGIETETEGDNSTIQVENRGDISVTAAGRTYGIYAATDGDGSWIKVTNFANIAVAATGKKGDAYGIYAYSETANSSVTVMNYGDITVQTNQGRAIGIYAVSDDENSNVKVVNTGNITALSTSTSSKKGGTYGIYAYADDDNSSVTVFNSGNITASAPNGDVYGIYAGTDGVNSAVKVTNSGNITVTAGGDYSDSSGIGVDVDDDDSPVEVVNSGRVLAQGTYDAYGIWVDTEGENSPIAITNRGSVTARVTQTSAYGYAIGLWASTEDDNSSITITNSGEARGEFTQNGPVWAVGIYAYTEGENSPTNIINSGSVYAEGSNSTGIYSYSLYANKTTITNTGTIGASSHLAIDVDGAGTANIYNAGTITGFVDLTEQNDKFINQAGGVFETKLTSFFGGGDDLFVNRRGGTIQAATNAGMKETSSFQGLETFRNAGGTVSMVDGGIGDKFTIANTPGGKDLKFEGGGFVAVDAHLRGPGSRADNFIIDGNVSGQTKVAVNNTSTQPGVFNSQGIPVVFVEGATPKESNFVLANGPIDTGFFDYDLFFVPTGSGFWELRSFVGGSAYTLPKLLTAAQDIWHESSSTWFDRTADLRVVLNGGTAAASGVAGGAPNGLTQGALTPGAWIKGGGSWLEREASATTKAYGRSYDYDLEGDLQTFDLQVGFDGGKYNVLSDGDALLVGILGGFVGGNLDFDALADQYQFSGGQVGAYATYMKDGLFVDTLLNVHLYEIDTPNVGMPGSLDATTVGLRTDAGYRFGSFTGGAFFEPLATLEVTWADIDGFSVAGNKVSFSDDANLRGRLGARMGTAMEVWEGTMMEPFLIASLWSNLSDNNSATLVSTGRTFKLEDDLQDVWGEVSAGVNLFNFSETTSVFAKVDYTFGEDISGLGGKGGIRVSW